MPIAFASILGGMVTMIGTPPNIIISNLRKEQQQKILSSALSDGSSQAAAYLDQMNILKESLKLLASESIETTSLITSSCDKESTIVLIA